MIEHEEFENESPDHNEEGSSEPNPQHETDPNNETEQQDETNPQDNPEPTDGEQKMTLRQFAKNLDVYPGVDIQNLRSARAADEALRIRHGVISKAIVSKEIRAYRNPDNINQAVVHTGDMLVWAKLDLLAKKTKSALSKLARKKPDKLSFVPCWVHDKLIAKTITDFAPYVLQDTKYEDVGYLNEQLKVYYTLRFVPAPEGAYCSYLVDALMDMKDNYLLESNLMFTITEGLDNTVEVTNFSAARLDYTGKKGDVLSWSPETKKWVEWIYEDEMPEDDLDD